MQEEIVEVEKVTAEEREGLRRIRTRFRWMWVVIIGYIPAGFVVAPLLRRSDKAAEIYSVAWIPLWLVAIWWAMRSRCPRCGGYFFQIQPSSRRLRDWMKRHPNLTWAFRGGFEGDLIQRRCRECGLPLKAADSS